MQYKTPDSTDFERRHEVLLPTERLAEGTFKSAETFTASEIKGKPDHPLHDLFTFGFKEVEIRIDMKEGAPEVEVAARAFLGRAGGEFLRTPTDLILLLEVSSEEGSERYVNLALDTPTRSSQYFLEDMPDELTVPEGSWEELESVCLQVTAALSLKYEEVRRGYESGADFAGDSDFHWDPEYAHLAQQDERELPWIIGIEDPDAVREQLNAGLFSPKLIERLRCLAEQGALSDELTDLFAWPENADQLNLF